MSLKTATLIALIGIIVHFCIVVFYMFSVSLMFRISPVLPQIVSVFSSMLFNGSIIFFLAVFYSKQKE
jgi:hypothetical protein